MAESQKLVLLVASGVTGLLIGSFLNVCIFRLPRNCMSIVKPRSRCPKCLHLIVWYDNLPVLSWLLLGGRCRTCKAPISPRYALVELLTGALYFYAGWRQLHGVAAPGWGQAAAFAVEAWLLGALVVCTFIDLDFRILPDEVTKSGIVIGLAVSAAFPFLTHLQGTLLDFVRFTLFLLRADRTPGNPSFLADHPHLAGLLDSLFGALVGGGTIWLVGVFGKWLFRKKIARLGETVAMGFGDVKYLAMLGAVLGWKGVLLTLMLASLFGTIFGLGKLLLVRRMGYVAFGPFLSAGAACMVLWPRMVYGLIGAYLRLTHAFSDWILSRGR